MRERLTLIRTIFVCLVICFPAVASFANTYYVRDDGSDGFAGRSHEKAFRTLSFAFEMLRSGDSLFLLSGNSWQPFETLFLNQDNVTIGAYHTNSSGIVVHSLSGPRPLIDGQTSVPRRGSYRGLIHITGIKSKVRDLEVRNSGGIGIRFHETSDGRVENVKSDWSYFYGIQAYRSSNIEIRDCEVVGFGRGGREFGERTFPNGISIRTSNEVLVAGNVVREGWGEGIDSYFGSTNIVIENNLVFAVRNIGIYIDSTHNAVVRNNVVLGTSRSEFHRYGDNTFVGPGIAINNEDYQFQEFGGSLTLDQMARDIKIYNNLVSGTALGLAIWGQHPKSTLTNATIVHNTFVDNDIQLSVAHDRLTNVEIGNNIFLTVSNSGEDYKGPGNSSPIRFVSNYWSQGRPDSRLVGKGDVYSGLVLSKMSGWRNVSSHLQVNWQNFTPQSGSGTIGSASTEIQIALSGDYNGTPLNRPPDIGAMADGTRAVTGGARPNPPFMRDVD